jgi:hypothetical protein
MYSAARKIIPIVMQLFPEKFNYHRRKNLTCAGGKEETQSDA